MGGGDVVQRRLIAAGLFLVGAYTYGLGCMVAFPSVMLSGILIFRRAMGQTVAPNADIDTLPVVLAISVFYLCTCLCGLCGMVASGGLWWNGNRLVIRVLVIAGALGALAQGLPTLAGSVGLMVFDPPNDPALLVVAILAVLPTLLFAALAALAVAALLVLGGPPASGD